MKYQAVLRRGTGGVVPYYYERLAFTDDVFGAKRLIVAAYGSRTNIVEEIVLVGENEAEVNAEYGKLTGNRPYMCVAIDDDAIRKAIEFAPLGEPRPYKPPTPFWNLLMPREQLRGLIRLMGRVSRGELGGPDDGLERYGAEGSEGEDEWSDEPPGDGGAWYDR